ncbi:DNA-binding transcriptional regulator, GntR family [Caldanaerovirga acetigignens]|uniref:DNA-binding transcriptional regulator, GntR family n=1 Tax=Caldanaerovirga acetigignens TaxID=447595 RepID=A0A1M7GLG4_9FIRM|nr:GntR family transcriptional regulator [Caldanaerovirga acetigignens]SHM16747.1 DNA-binding transcriptional regulator, GntR family [Caldanaerovirga acetigignens]
MLTPTLESGASLRNKIYQYLKNAILNGVYKPGESLIEMKIAKELGVSRTPVREAIRQLELEGLVSSIPNKGVIVEGVTEQDVEDIYTIRKMIEGLAARWAAEKITPEQLKELKDVVDLMEFYTKRGEIDKVSELDTRFHDIIFKACKSRPLESVLTNFHHFIQRARLVSIKSGGRAPVSLEEHKEIYTALEARDPEAAEKAMIKHVEKARRNLHPYLEGHKLYQPNLENPC